MQKRKVVVQPEQLYVLTRVEGRFLLGGSLYEQIPWHLLTKSFLYCLTEEDLRALLVDAASRSYMILDGASSDRRGLRGFSVAIGPWGWRGQVECRTVDAWCLIETEGLDPESQVAELQERLRELCGFLNAEATTFRPTALAWLGSLYTRLGRPMEPGDGFPPPLSPDVAMLCRRAHIGGPIVHVRTELAPYVSLDRKRAYGEALLDFLPSGECSEVDLGHRPMMKWGPKALMRATGVAEATVRVKMAPLVPLLPIMRWHYQFERTRTLYPTGELRGCWTLQELSYLEQSGRGEVVELHRVVVFEKAKPFSSMVRYLRKIEPQLDGVQVKRLEHMLYGKCARALSLSRFASSRGDVRPMPSDILDTRTVERLTTRVELRPFGLPAGHAPALPLYEVRGQLSEDAPHGTMDRPDRSAWITSSNRIEMCRIIDRLDEALGAGRSGEYVGRIYVDGIDIEASVADIPAMEGVEVRRHGPRMRLYRAGVYVSELDDGSRVIEDAGILGGSGTVQDLELTLTRTPDPDGGPLAGGRHWQPVDGYEDPRMAPGQISQPLHLDLPVVDLLGFSDAI
jgi:hypothetical protein